MMKEEGSKLQRAFWELVSTFLVAGFGEGHSEALAPRAESVPLKFYRCSLLINPISCLKGSAPAAIGHCVVECSEEAIDKIDLKSLKLC